ncbi:tandem-95 repeat protein, partial [Magnetospirillum sp. LM-5]|uniref:tandem-95 repeat protein n=1 Tax=Magnetospirillum sp. LM-5 TaxID=2681466 RepID=UPI00156F2646
MADDLDENQTNAQTDNPNSGSQGVAQQALDDLTVLSDVGNQNMGETRLNVARAVDVNDAALGSLATIHQGSNEGEQIQQGLDLQVGEIVQDEVSVDQAKTTVIETPPVAELDGAAAEAAQDVAVDTRLNVRIQDDLSEQNVIFGDPIVIEQNAEEAVAPTATADAAVIDAAEIVPEAALDELFVDAPPAIGGIYFDDPATSDPTLVPLGSPQTINEDGELKFVIDAVDPDGGSVSISFSQPAHGSITVNGDGSYSYTPDENYFSSYTNQDGTFDFADQDSFTVFVSDDEGNTISQTVTIDIKNVDDESVFTMTGGAGDEDTTITGTISATDIDGAIVSYELVGDATHGSVTVNADGSYSFTPDADWNGSDSFTVRVYDDKGGFSDQEVTVDVAAVADEAVITVSNTEGVEDSTITGQISISDADGGVASVEFITVPEHGVLEFTQDGQYRFTPDPDWNGTDSVTIRVTDAKGGTTEQTIELNVAAVNDAATSDGIVIEGSDTPVESVAISEDSGLTFAVDVTDAEGGAVDIAFADNPNGSVTVNDDGTFTFTPTGDFTGATELTYTVTDSEGMTTTNTVTINVGAVEDEAVVTATGGSGAEDNVVTGTISATDVDGGVVSIELVGDAAHGSVTVNADGTYSFSPDENWNGTDSFTVLVTDANGGTTEQTVTVNVGAVEDEAVVTVTGGEGSEDGVVTGSISATDVDGGIASIELVGDAAHGSVELNPDGTYSFTPDADWNGTDSFTVVVTDANGGTTEQTITVNVEAVNDAATTDGIVVAGSDTPVESVSISEDSGLVFAVDVTDAEGGAVDIAFADNPNGSVTVNDDGTFTFTPTGDFAGTTELTYTVTDSEGVTTTNTVTVNVGAVEDEAVVTATGGSGTEDNVVTGSISATDVDGGVVSIELVGDAAHGSVELNPDGTYSFTPDADWNGS